MQVTTGKRSRPQRVVIYGTEGIGKTTLAAAFPDPIFIDVDRGSDHLDVSRTEPDTWAGITATITDIISTPGQYKTIVLDAADAAERMAIAHVCDKHKKADIEAFGYGKGYTLLADVWNDLLKLLNTAIDAGYNVVIIAHAHIRKFEKPDESQGFDRYTLKLTDAGKTSLSAQTKEWCDALLF
jgi:hypothetical protein